MKVAIAFVAALLFLVSSADAATVEVYGSTGSNPFGIIIDAEGNIYTANNIGNSVSRINTGGSSFILGATGQRPMGIVADSQGNLYTSNSSSNNVSKIFLSGGSTILSSTGTSPYGISIDSEDNIYTANNNSANVSKIFPGGAVATWMSTGNSPWPSVIDEAENLFIGNWVSQTVTRFSLAGNPTTYAALNGAPRELIIDNNSTLYSGSVMPNLKSAIEKITASGAVSTLASLPCPLGDIVIDSGYNIYVSTYNCSGNIYKIEPNGNFYILAKMSSSYFSYGIALDSSGNLFLTSFHGNTVDRVSPSYAGEISPAPPAIPTTPLASAGVESATVSLPANPDDARYGTPSSYTVAVSDNPEKNCTITPPAVSCEIASLQGGTPYTFIARANLNAWQSTPSAPSSVVVPKERYLLSVQKSGSGTVTSTPAGISCGSNCSALFAEGQTVSLEASAAPGWQFVGWSGGGCSGTVSCQVEMDEAQSVDAIFKQNFLLSVSKSGSGAVLSYPAGISCGSDCQSLFPEGTEVELVAWPESGYLFQGWSGACQGEETCLVNMNSAKSVEAVFVAAVNYPLLVQRNGSGSGSVRSLPAGISCGGDCSHQFIENTPVTLKAEPSPGATFTGWSGACSGTGDCSLTMNAAKTAIAQFSADLPPPGYVNLSVNKSGDGSGLVSSGQINCGNVCNYYFPLGAAVTLEAEPNSGSSFQGWSGACTGTDACTLLLTGSTTVNAAFDSNPPQPGFYYLSTLRGGTGSGKVISDPLGINCGKTCTVDFLENTDINLGATPDGGSDFSGWSAPCAGTGTCSFLLDESLSIAAYFTKRFSLEVSSIGPGEIISNPGGIDCKPDCSANFSEGSEVTVEADPSPGARFQGWTGACTGSGPCRVAMNNSKNVQAVFIKTFPLTVARRGSGKGSVSSTPLGIDCGTTCTYSFDEDQMIALHASPQSGSRFQGWKGACVSDPCRVTMNQAQNVEAVFSRNISMRVKKIKRKTSSRKAVLISNIYVSDAGIIMQKSKRGKKSWCFTKKRVYRAGTYTLRCQIQKKYLQVIKKRKTRLSVESSFSAYEEKVVRNNKISIG